MEILGLIFLIIIALVMLPLALLIAGIIQIISGHIIIGIILIILAVGISN